MAVLFESREHLLEQDPFVRGMLVEQDQAAVRFEHDIEPPDHSYESQRDVEQRDRRAGRGRNTSGGSGCGRGGKVRCRG